MLRKKLLLIVLLIVGCDEVLEPEDCAGVVGGDAVEDNCGTCDNESPNQCDVAWMIAMEREYVAFPDTNFLVHESPILYWTDGYEPYRDTTIVFSSSYGIACFSPAIVNQDTLCEADSVSSIYHFVEPNYFKVLDDSDSLIIYPYEHEIESMNTFPYMITFEVFKYKYK